MAPSAVGNVIHAFAGLTVCVLDKPSVSHVHLVLDPHWPPSCLWTFTAEDAVDIHRALSTSVQRDHLQLDFVGMCKTEAVCLRCRRG
jgi:hypothetical protein